MIVLQKRFALPSLVVMSFFLLLTAACGVSPTLASGSLDSAKPAPGTTLLTFKNQDLLRHARWSPDGRQIASIDFSDRILKKWDATTGKILWQVKITNDNNLAWSHDGKYIAVGTFTSGGVTSTENAKIVIVDSQSGKLLQTFLDPANEVDNIAWSPDDKRIATGDGDGKLRLWNSATGQIQAAYPQNEGPIYAMAWSPDGKYIAIAGHNDRFVHVWDTKFGQQNPFFYGGHSDTVTSLSWSPDGKNLASSSNDRTIQIWNALSMKRLLTIHTNSVDYVAYSHDGKQLATVDGGRTYTASIYDASTGRSLLVYKGHSGFVYDAQWSSDDQRIASASADATVKIWQAR